MLHFGYPPFVCESDTKEEYDKKMENLIKNGFKNKFQKGRGPWFPEEKYISEPFKNLILSMLDKNPVSRITISEILNHIWLLDK